MRSNLFLVDMDGTLCKSIEWTIPGCLSAEPNVEMINKTNNLYQENVIIVYTARRDELIPATLEWLRRHNVRYHAISNLKIPADYYVDDKMISFEEFLGK